MLLLGFVLVSLRSCFLQIMDFQQIFFPICLSLLSQHSHLIFQFFILSPEIIYLASFSLNSLFGLLLEIFKLSLSPSQLSYFGF